VDSVHSMPERVDISPPEMKIPIIVRVILARMFVFVYNNLS